MRAFPVAACVLGALAMAMLAGCSKQEQPARHVLIVTLDTTRADRLGAYGRANAGTPWLDSLARQGTRVDRAYTVAPITLPAHVSLFTGRIPPRTGVHINGQRELPASVPTLAETLRTAGFFTAAAVGGYPVGRSTPVSRGFGAYDDTFADRRNPSGVERDAGLVVQSALALARQRGEKRLFLWVHLFDAHDPYEPPSPFREQHSADLYQGEIARMDAALANLDRGLREALGDEPLLIAVVADHGESLGEHGEDTHGFFVYESTVRVPMIFAGPRVPKERVISGPVSIVDIAPTIYSLLDMSAPADMDGGIIDFSNAAFEATGPVYVESELPLRNYGWSELTGVIAGAEKLIEAPRPELYDVVADPGETRNLLPGAAAKAETLRALLTEFVMERVDGGDAEADPALASLGYVSLRQGGDPRAERIDPKDRISTYQRFQRASRLLESGRPGDALRIYDELFAEERTDGLIFKRAQTLRMLGRFAEADDQLDGLPQGMAGIPLEKGRIAIATERWDDARRWLGIHLTASPRDAEALMLRGAAAEFLGDPAAAESDYRASRAANPLFAAASLRLAALFVTLGRNTDAAHVLEEHLRVHPQDELASGLLGAIRSGG